MESRQKEHAGLVDPWLLEAKAYLHTILQQVTNLISLQYSNMIFYIDCYSVMYLLFSINRHCSAIWKLLPMTRVRSLIC
jgi:hypothetical protein